MIAVSVLAHAGGVDEAAMIGLPIVLFALFFFLERRARRREQAEAQADEVPPDDEV